MLAALLVVQVWPAHPLRLSMALNFSVFCHENLGDTKQAVKIAKRYFDGAVTNLSDTARSSRQQCSRILDVLAENIQQWDRRPS
jgi:14-3-3 protein